MTTISPGPIQSFQTYTPYSPLGKPPVGLESADTKTAPLPPVEEAANGAKPENREQSEAVSPDPERRRQADSQAAVDSALTEEEVQQVRELAARDREVRAHEAAHAAVGGSLAGAASFRYVRGPDGVRYAVSGEVPISIGAVAGDPAATLRNAEQVRAAALAPAQPSAQDLRVAADAAQLALQAQLELAALRTNGQSAGQPTAAERSPSQDDEAGTSDRRVSAYTSGSTPGSLLDQTI